MEKKTHMAKAGLILFFQISQQYLTKIKRLIATTAMIAVSLTQFLLICQIPTPLRIVIRNHHFGQKKRGVEAPYFLSSPLYIVAVSRGQRGALKSQFTLRYFSTCHNIQFPVNDCPFMVSCCCIRKSREKGR
jgi:hypothetical protein